jgi:hypothetical protein
VDAVRGAGDHTSSRIGAGERRARPGIAVVPRATPSSAAASGAGGAPRTAASSSARRPDRRTAPRPHGAPTLLIVGGHDDVVLALNRQAQALLAAPDTRLAVVPGATHLFEEPGALPAVANLARHWFTDQFAPHLHHVVRATGSSGRAAYRLGAPYLLGAADRALADLAADRITGATVLVT